MESFDEIVAFARVVQAGSFAGGAQLLGVTPSAISKAVSRLEKRLGTQLLRRTTRSIALTDAGRAYHASCVDILKRVAEAECEIACMTGRPAGRLRIGAPIELARVVIAPALPRFLAKYPGLSLQLSSSDRVVDLIEEGLDAVIRVGQLDDSSLHVRRLGAYPLVLVAAPAFVAAHGEPASPDDLDPAHCLGLVHPNTGQLRAWTLRRGDVVRTVEPGNRLAFDALGPVLAATVAGAGVACIPYSSAAPGIADGSLVAVLTDWDAGTRQVSLLFAGDGKPLAKLRVFVEFCVELFGGDPRPALRVVQGTGTRRTGTASAGSQPAPKAL